MALLCLFILAAAILPVITAGPQLLSDVKNGPDWEKASDLEVKLAKCTRHWFIISDCTVEYSTASGPVGKNTKLEYFVLGSWGNEQVQLIHSKLNPAVVTSTIAIRDIGWRIASMALWVLFFASTTLAGRVQIRRRSARQTARYAPPEATPDFGAMQPPRGQYPAARATFGKRGER